jgi:murein endopeptidase
VGVRRRFALIAATVASVAVVLAPGPPRAQAASAAVGLPADGRLVGGVMFPAASESWFTWNFPGSYGPNPAWRRYGTDRLVAMVKRVLTAYSLAHPEAARPGVADLSRPKGGWFGAEYGGLGHRSHQNGLDADILYPRTDLCECAPDVPADVDRRLAQDLLNRFVAEGVQYVFTGPSLGLRGPRGVVIPLRHHDNHMHVRIHPPRSTPQPGRTPPPVPAAPVDGDGPAPTGGVKASAGDGRFVPRVRRSVLAPARR